MPTHEPIALFDKNGNVTTQARWVSQGEGMAYRSFTDGVSLRVIDGRLWQYAELPAENSDKNENVTFMAQGQLANGKQWGWLKLSEDARANSKARRYLDYFSQEQARRSTPMPDGVYILTEEAASTPLGNPEFIQRGDFALPDAPRTYQALADYFRARPGLSAIKFQHSDYAPVVVARSDVGVVVDEKPEAAEADVEESPATSEPKSQDAPTKIIRRKPKAETEQATEESNDDATSSDDEKEAE